MMTAITAMVLCQVPPKIPDTGNPALNVALWLLVTVTSLQMIDRGAFWIQKHRDRRRNGAAGASLETHLNKIHKAVQQRAELEAAQTGTLKDIVRTMQDSDRHSRDELRKISDMLLELRARGRDP